MTLYMPGDWVRLPNGKLAQVELARQTTTGRPLDVVEVYFKDARSPWASHEHWHPSHLIPVCAACCEETTRVRRFDDELLCLDCFMAEVERRRRLP